MAAPDEGGGEEAGRGLGGGSAIGVGLKTNCHRPLKGPETLQPAPPFSACPHYRAKKSFEKQSMNLEPRDGFPIESLQRAVANLLGNDPPMQEFRHIEEYVPKSH